MTPQTTVVIVAAAHPHGRPRTPEAAASHTPRRLPQPPAVACSGQDRTERHGCTWTPRERR